MRNNELRLIAKLADLYYRRGLTQSKISKQLGMHQSTVSRLLKRAEKEGLVTISLNYPVGFYADLEAELEVKFGLSQAIIVDSAQSDRELVNQLGSALAAHFSNTVRAGDVVGISSWSTALLAMVNSMQLSGLQGDSVVQILGGIGNPAAENHATQLTRRLAQLINGEPVLLSAPGVVENKRARNILLKEPYVKQAVDRFEKVNLALVGIGALQPSPLLADSGNVVPEEALRELKALGAVGDICLRFFDTNGKPVKSAVEDTVIGMSLAQLKNVRSVIGVAGGERKRDAILASLRGGWLDVLVTDLNVAQYLASAEPIDA